MNDKYPLEDFKVIKDNLLGGHATLTLESQNTGKWFTYKIRTPEEEDSKGKIFWVSVLNGPDNISSYSYIGLLVNSNGNIRFQLTNGSKCGKESLSYKAFDYFTNNIKQGRLNPQLKVYHMGTCSRCGRPLTTPDSISLGIGPICISIPKK